MKKEKTQTQKPAKEKREKKAPEKKTPNTKETGKVHVSFFHQLRFKLIVSFLVPVICIVLLGVISYTRAANAITSSYESSVSQTMDMMNQYLSFEVDTVRSTYKTYLNDGDLIKYLSGSYSITPETETNTYKTYLSSFQSNVNLDSLVSNIYVLVDGVDSIATTNVTGETPFTNYLASATGSDLKDDRYNYYLFGNQDDANSILNADSNSYALRLARRYSSQCQAVLIVDISKDAVISTLSAIDPSEDGFVALITRDGTEYYADGTSTNADTVFSSASWYQDAVNDEAENGMQYVTYQGKKYLFLYSALSDYDAMLCTMIPRAVIVGQASSIRIFTVILVIISALIAGLLGTVLASHINKNILYILRNLRKVSNGDLTVSLTPKTKDEFSLLGDGINATVSNMKGLITQVTAAGGTLREMADQVHSSADSFVQSSKDIQGAISEIESGATNLDENAADCVLQMDTLSGKIHDVTNGAGEIEALADAAGTAIADGIVSMDTLTKSAEKTSQITEHVIDAVSGLSEKSRAIGQIVETINSIARETNLLSLNASIEAARAGEAGRGFAVVAEEIRELADQSAASASQIQTIISDISDNTAQVVDIAREAADTVSSQEKALEQTTASFHDMDDQIHSLIASLEQITQNVGNMEQARSTTLAAVESISSVSAETAAGTTNVSTTVSSQQDTIKTLEAAAASLQDHAEQLTELLQQFTIR